MLAGAHSQQDRRGSGQASRFLAISLIGPQIDASVPVPPKPVPCSAKKFPCSPSYGNLGQVFDSGSSSPCDSPISTGILQISLYSRSPGICGGLALARRLVLQPVSLPLQFLRRPQSRLPDNRITGSFGKFRYQWASSRNLRCFLYRSCIRGGRWRRSW